MDENKDIGKALKLLRSNAGYSADDVAASLGHTSSWLYDIESGRRNINFRDARALCDFYGVSVDYLSKIIDKISAL